PNFRDLDSDNDGINDVREAGGLTDANGDGKADGTDADGDGMIDNPQGHPVDTDGDGVRDFLDLDSDNDGVSDLVEGGQPGIVDADGDGVADGPDADHDGIVDSADGNDAGFGDAGDPPPANPDGDGLPSYLDRDSDGDGIDDIDEAGLGDLDHNNDGKIDNPTDLDHDGVPDVIDNDDAGFGGLPNAYGDDDGDGISNGAEGNGAVDTDGDGIPDSADADSDGDGIPDSVEGNGDADNDGIPDRRERDADGDGIDDVIEAGGVDVNHDGKADGVDADGDGIPASADPDEGGTALPTPDTDGDGTPNYRDADDDGDGVPTADEGADPNGDGNPSDAIDTDHDGTPNYLDDDDDGDGISTADEGTGDRDRDGVPDYLDFDPTGYFYDEVSGAIVPGGLVTISGPGPVTVIDDGSSGFYQFIGTVAGVYNLSITYPPGWIPSATCQNQDPPSFDPTGGPNPTSLGAGENGSTGFLTSNSCTAFYRSFDLTPGDPLVINNNIPLRVQQPTAVQMVAYTVKATADGTVDIDWETATELEVLGFNLYRRSLADGGEIKANGALIPATGSAAAGNRYHANDEPGAGRFYYRLAVVQADGESDSFGPTHVTVVRPPEPIRIFLPYLVKPEPPAQSAAPAAFGRRARAGGARSVAVADRTEGRAAARLAH
ncbi:MAG: hypothetical protein ABI780_07635, partial [Ardenticatenales bacterium]